MHDEGARPAAGPVPAAARKSLRRRIGKAAAVSAITLFLIVLLLEILGRISPSILGPELYIGPGMTEEDPGTGRRLRPGTHGKFRIISIPGLPPEVGFRDNGPDASRRFRVLALGDSFTFGDGVELESCWTELLEPRLDASVLNAGMGASGAEYAADFLSTYGFRLEPDLVLYSFFAGNDVLDSGVSEGVSIRRFGAGRQWLDGHSVTYRAAKLAGRRVLPLGSEEMKSHRADVGGEEAGFWPSMLGFNSRKAKSEEFSAALEHCEKLILRMKGECAGKGVPFAVAVFPFKEQVHFDVVKQWLDDPADYDPSEPGKSIEEFCLKSGIPVANLTPLFMTDASRNLYLPFDSHWNEKGNALAAQGLEGFLKGLLAGSSSGKG